MAPRNILIIGNSIAGPTLASFLLLSPVPAAQKPHITLLERSSAFRSAGQNIDIRGAGLPLIRKLGLEAEIRASTTGEDGVEFVDDQDRAWGRLAADRSGKTRTPTADIEITRGKLAEICYERSKDISKKVQAEGGKGVEYLFGDYLDDIDQDGDQVHVRFAKTGAKRSFDLVVGADGLQSKTRSMVFGAQGDESVKRLGMYSGFFSMPNYEKYSTWRRWWRTSRRRSIMLRPDKLNSKTTVLISVVNEEDERLPAAAERHGPKAIEAQRILLKEYFSNTGWESDRIVKEMMEADDFYYDAVAQVKMPTFYKGRVVLLGDAGYCASPISGMGTTLALNGAYNLAGALLQHPNDHAAAFEAYETKMRPIVDRAQKLVPGMPHLLHPETAWGVWTLNAIMWTLQWSGIVKLLFMFVGPPADEVKVDDYGLESFVEDEILKK